MSVKNYYKNGPFEKYPFVKNYFLFMLDFSHFVAWMLKLILHVKEKIKERTQIWVTLDYINIFHHPI